MRYGSAWPRWSRARAPTNLSDFLAYIHGAGYPRENVLAVVTTNDHTDPTARDSMLNALTPTATVVCEPATTGTITTAFNTQAFPAFYLTNTHATLTATGRWR